MALAMALSNMVQHKVAEKGRSISHAIDIITNGLRASLDVEAGGEMAERMYALYEYMGTRLVIANANNDAAPIEEVTHLLSELRSAWEEIADDPAVVSANRVAS
jgi:flagellar protein FliS